MQIQHQFLISIYFFCVITITIILFSFIFNIITKRLFGTDPIKTKLYYLEIFGVWLILAYLMYNLRTKINKYSKKQLTKYVSLSNKNDTYENIYDEIDQMEKFNMIVIIGFVAIFIGSQQQTYKEKLFLLNEDIGILGEAFG